jgi:hypothetical protein
MLCKCETFTKQQAYGTRTVAFSVKGPNLLLFRCNLRRKDHELPFWLDE